MVEAATMSTAPKVVREGDQIIGLYVASSSIALRLSYVVLGPVYIRRNIEGHVFQRLERNDIEPQQFTMV